MLDLDRAWAARPAVQRARALAAYRRSPTARRARRRKLFRVVVWTLIAAGLVLALNLIGSPYD